MCSECRIDKFLWMVRVFKSRSLATTACKSKHVIINNKFVKPSRIVQAGITIEIKQAPIVRTFKILDIPKSRLSAKLVKDYAIDTTDEGEYMKLKLARTREGQREKGAGRPTKKERRIIDKFKDE